MYVCIYVVMMHLENVLCIHLRWVDSYDLLATLDRSGFSSSTSSSSGSSSSRSDSRSSGGVIVFDDSFEHEVAHTGPSDRFVLLVVLNHPDVLYHATPAATTPSWSDRS